MLIGVGLGPGSPDLLTIKAVRLLKEADRVFVPGGIARNLVEEYCNPVELSFPMSRDEDAIERQIRKNAEIIAPFAENGLAVFGIIGDPNLFSTFSRLCTILREEHPGIEFQTVPGISSVTALASVTGTPISGSFSVSDGSPERIHIRMKVTEPRKQVEELEMRGYNSFVLVERMFMENMKIYSANFPEKSNYFSILYAEKR